MADPSLSTIIGIDDIVGDLARELDLSIHGLYRRLDPVRSRVAIFPSQCRETIELFTEDDIVVFDFNFYQDTRRFHVADDEFDVVHKVKLGSPIFNPDNELLWSKEIYEPVLRTALQGRDDVTFLHIPHVRISPTDILSSYGVSSEAVAASTVHYAICIEPTDLMAERLAKAARDEEGGLSRPGQSVNPTRYELLRTRPIGVTIQTQRSPTPQFSLWAAAQFERMRRLFPTAPLPTLPAIFVAGTAWELYFVAPPRNGAAGVRVYKDGRILADTGSVEGTYQLLAALRRLADWVGADLRGWWEGNLPMAVDRGLATDRDEEEEDEDEDKYRDDGEEDDDDDDEAEGETEDEDEDEGDEEDEDEYDEHDYEDDEYVD